MRLRVREQSAELPFDQEYVPGLWIVRIAGEYATTHRLVGPWFRRVCVFCATKGRCEYGRWSDDVLIAEVRREWLGC